MSLLIKTSIMGALLCTYMVSSGPRASDAPPRARFISEPMIMAPFTAPNISTVPNSIATIPNNIVGDYSFVGSTDIFLPNTLCHVDPSLDLLAQLQQCKIKRKGWLRL